MNHSQDDLLKQVKRIHFIGIGGSGMSPLAETLQAKGYELTGSDVSEGDNVTRMRSLGIPVLMGHRAENVHGAQLVVHTAAVHKDNPEMIEAERLGIPVMERSVLLGSLSRQFGCTIAVSGTHGKTTATSMLSQVLLMAEKDPTVIIGGRLPLIDSNGRAGKSSCMVCEACEYVDSFLQLTPAVSIILNIDADHLDYFGTLENIIRSFRRFCEQTSRLLIINGDNENTLRAVEGLNHEIVTFGESERCDYFPRNITVHDGSYYEYDLMRRGEALCHIRLGVPGRHNVANSLAVCAAALDAGVTSEQLERFISAFTGAGRRFEIYGEFSGVRIIDDYAHHPTEIRATLAAAKKMKHRRLWAIFQPFTFSRTVTWLDQFAQELSAADRVVLSPILGSREINEWGVRSEDIAAKMENAVCLPDFPSIAEYLAQHAEPGDMIITMGGGDIYKCARMIRDALCGRDASCAGKEHAE